MNITNLDAAETVVLSDGEFPSHEIPLTILNNVNYLVCCDGAVNQLSATNKRPDAVVGDCDSVSAENKIKFASILHKDKDQDTNDLTKAIKFCIAQNKTKICILGATGKREDHTLANISLLSEYLNLGLDVQMITDHGIFVAITNDTVFDSYKGQQVSIFSIDQSVITSRGLLYPIDNRIFTNWWQGSLNESLGKSFEIKTKKRVIIYRVF